MNGKVTLSAIVVSLVVLLDQIALGLRPALAQVARVELHALTSATLTDQQFLTGQREGTPVILAGELRLPRPGTERLPAVVLVHSSAGVVGRIDTWARWLNDLGVATFVLDAFSGRGLVNISADQGKLGRLNTIVDSYRALELLARHARIDPQRIAIMGFSRGGNAALYADKPVRIFHGALDDFAPPAPCRPYVARLQKAGRDVQHTVYPGAHHVFDSPAIKVPIQFPQSQTARRCRLEEAEGGRIVNSATKQTFTYEDPCVERGPTLGYNENAAREVEKAVKAFLTATFRLQ